MERELFSLGDRLQLCADLVQKGCNLVDVGTDHAYLPIWLAKTGVISEALACDVREGPLESAAQNIKQYHVENLVQTRLSDGLRNVSSDEADNVVIAGMGGELILRIIVETDWLKDKSKKLILQPMTSSMELRLGLVADGFEIEREIATVERNKVYSVISAAYSGESKAKGELFPYMGKLQRGEAFVSDYAKKTMEMLGKQLRGHKEGSDEHGRITQLIRKISEEYCEV